MRKIVFALAAFCWATPAFAGPIVTARPAIVARPVTIARPVVTYRAPTPTVRTAPKVSTPSPSYRAPLRRTTPWTPSPIHMIPIWGTMTNMGAHSVGAENQFKAKCRRTPPEKHSLACKRALREA